MMQTLSTNSAKKNKNVALFDISRVYRDVNGQISEGKNPTEEMLVTFSI